MKPWLHSKVSVQDFGGIETDYNEIHNFFDETKAHFADMRHRSLHHHSYGIFLAEKLFGFPHSELEQLAISFEWSNEEKLAVANLIKKSKTNEVCNIMNSNGKLVSVRDIAEQHVLDDMGRIPSVHDYLQGMPRYSWLGGLRKKTRKIPLVD